MGVRLVYIYTALGGWDTPTQGTFDPEAPANNYFVDEFREEGHFWLLNRLLDQRVFDEVLFVVDSRGAGRGSYRKGFPYLVVPHIDLLDQFLRPNDILWVRGGFKSWFEFLRRQQSHWTLLYRAGTNRGGWKWWDCVLDDLCTENHTKHNRLTYWYKKPTHPIFHAQDRTEKEYKYDYMLGASHIYDRKGQYRAVNAMRYLMDKRAVLPGAVRHSEMTNQIVPTIKKYNLPIDMLSHAPRFTLATVMNNTKLFVLAGGYGQNDRGVLEAMRCGMPMIITSPQYHAPLLRGVTGVFPPEILDRPQQLAKFIRDYEPPSRQQIIEYYKSMTDEETVILPRMTKLFEFMKSMPKNRAALMEHFMKDNDPYWRM